MLPFLLIFVPIIGGVLTAFLKLEDRLRDRFVLAVTAVTGLLGLFLFGFLRETGVVVLEFPRLLPPFGVSFRIDWLSVILVTISSAIWLLVTIYSFDYIKPSKHINRYHAFTLICYGAILGTLLAGDLLTLFLFFLN